jgi:hypothetical protein
MDDLGTYHYMYRFIRFRRFMRSILQAYLLYSVEKSLVHL